MELTSTVILAVAIQILIGVLIGAYLHRISRDYPIADPESKSADNKIKEDHMPVIEASSLDEDGTGDSAFVDTTDSEEVHSGRESRRIPVEQS